MSETLPTVRADFFGKDKFVPFIGIVEDVKDPKQGNRVRVRCVGWHPKDKEGEDGVKTEDLPWAKVGMPTTHAQQGRVGGKHGLLPGCWVFGCFLDGDEAQQPFVITTFGFTPKASDQSTRVNDKNTGGTQSENVPGFPKTDSNDNAPNIDVTTTKEQGGQVSDPEDPDADSVLNDSDDGCGSLQSTASDRRMNQPLKVEDKSDAESQNYQVSAGDGLCGSIAHASEDIQRRIKERIPSAASRFIYGDAVWNTFNGNYVDLNGLFLRVAIEISNQIIQPSQAQKAFTEDTVNRLAKSQGLLVPDRDGLVTIASDVTTSTKDDAFHGIFATGFIDILLQLIMQLLQNANNGGGGGNEGNNAGGEIGVNPNTNIQNNEAQCLTDDLLVNIIAEVEASIERAQRDSSNGGGGNMGAIFGIIGALSNVMQFALVQKGAVHPEIFNKSGPMSQDANTKDRGCAPDRLYSTIRGFSSALGGSLGGGGGGGSAINPTNPGQPGWENTGFGGIDKSTPIIPTNGAPCEDATTPVKPDDGTQFPGIGEPGSGDGGTDNENPFPGIGDEQITTNPDGSTTITFPGNTVTVPSDPLFPGIGTENFNPPNNVPNGQGGAVVPLPLPSDESSCANNFKKGIPNVAIVIRKGKRYFFNNPLLPQDAFPSIFIPGYNGTPVPVVDRDTGELFAILTVCENWNPNKPAPPVTIIPDDNSTGITTDQTDLYDFVIGGFLIENTGFNYCNPTVKIVDRNTLEENGAAEVTIVDGRVVDVELINNGTGFRRIPSVVVVDNGSQCGTQGGHGAKIYPIMNVIAKDTGKPQPEVVQSIYCPAKNQKNLI